MVPPQSLDGARSSGRSIEKGREWLFPAWSSFKYSATSYLLVAKDLRAIRRNGPVRARWSCALGRRGAILGESKARYHPRLQIQPGSSADANCCSLFSINRTSFLLRCRRTGGKREFESVKMALKKEQHRLGHG